MTHIPFRYEYANMLNFFKSVLLLSVIAIAPLAATINLADAALAQTAEVTETCRPGQALEGAAYKAFDMLQNNRPADALQALQKPLEIALQKPSSRPQSDFLTTWLLEGHRLYSPTRLEQLARAGDQPAQSPLLLSTLVQFSQIASRLPLDYSYVKTRSFAAIAHQYTVLDPGQNQQALQALEQARLAARSIQGEIFTANALIDVAETYALIDEKASAQAVLAQIEEAIEKIPPNSSESLRGEILQRVATAYAQIGDFTKAQDVAARLPEQNELQSIALRGIVEGFIKLQQLSEAEASAQSISAPTQRILAFEKLAIAYQNANQPTKADRLIGQAQQLAETDNSLPNREYVLKGLAEAYLQLGQRDTALQIATSLTVAQPEAIQSVMTAFRQAGQNDVVESWLSEQLSNVETTSEYWEQQSNLAGLVSQAIATQQFEWISKEWSRIAAINSGAGLSGWQMVEAATAYASTGQTEQAAAWVKQLPLSKHPVLRVKSLAAIALNAYQSGQTDSANSLMEETLQSVDALVADYQSQPLDYLEEASQIKSGAFTALAVVYSQMGQTDLMSQLLQEVGKTDRSITNPYIGGSSEQPFEVFWIAEQYVGALQIAQATSAESTEGKDVRDWRLRVSASSLPQQDRFDLALPVVDQLTQDSSKVSLLLAITQRYGELQQVDTALLLLDKALQLAQTIPGAESQFEYGGGDGTTEVPIESDRGGFLEAIALQYAQLKQSDRAVQVANRLQEASLRQQVLQAVRCKIQEQE